ncbi:hypothetical protein T4A_13682 [Trichinella pseudospiralis]|uniref:Uncharacterized protein n=1 Tax=Trichinella pseudospiralis TaxID=6337 RepID=A0A0V1J2Y3_TRIPS|nr:hypothetical protein T4A_13682 [Trichinella pseudospiralis]KRZ29351.1 hypothetical protein T4C_1641 [Trichinella pseudospiralis]
MHIYDNSLKRVHKHLLLAATDKAGNEDCTWPKWAGHMNTLDIVACFHHNNQLISLCEISLLKKENFHISIFVQSFFVLLKMKRRAGGMEVEDKEEEEEEEEEGQWKDGFGMR